ncbi:MAG: hypothetical protein NFCOHLIN_00790 [Gammaproteobacteria bacterium]|nr:hypothetical protein [Gammaproteobacteria bacterium]
MAEANPRHSRKARRRLTRWVLVAFILTFILARALVLLIMARVLPDLYLYIGGTHVHHLNMGIFALAAVAGILLFMPPRGRLLTLVAVGYGIGLALTFDEFGMWLHLGGGYWQRASFDAVTVIGGALLLLAYTPPFWQWSQRRWLGGGAMLLVVALFFWLLLTSTHHFEQEMAPRLERLEESAPR